MTSDDTVLDRPSEPTRARRSLAAGVIALRWAAYAWMFIANLVEGRYEHPAVAWAVIAGAGLWTAFLSATLVRRMAWVPWVDLALSVDIIVLSGYVVPDQTVMGERLFFAATYPIGTALTWGEAKGPWAGAAVSVAMGLALLASRPVNGFALGDLTVGDLGLVANGMVAYLLAAIAGGVTSVVLDRWAADYRILLERSMRERERAARFAEREALARQIHDSVLQSLSMVDKRARELAERGDVTGEEVGALAAMARAQEQELRALVMRPPEDAPTGTASLRDALEGAAREVSEPPVTVSAVGALHLPAGTVAEVAAAVRQALANVVEHARASRVTIYADADDTAATITVRDDGRGFDYDERALARAGKAGLLRSIKGRVEDLGGSLTVETRPGAGTELEIRVPRA